MTEPTIWGIYAGRTSDADNLFLKKRVIALGWDAVGDLSRLAANRDSFKVAVSMAYPDKKPGAIPVDAGKLFRFVHEMKQGDFVIYPSKEDKKVHIGRVEGSYQYNPGLSETYPNQRPVTWLKTFLRTDFSQGALYEIGSAMSFFQVKNYADEFLAVLEGKAAPPPIAEDRTVAYVAEDILQVTRDFVLKTLAQQLKGHPLADLVAHLLNKMGYHTRLSPPGPDGGIDIIAHRDELGFEPPIIKVQVKSGSGNVGDPQVSSLYGKVEQSEYGLVIALGRFTPQAKNFASNKSNLRLIDGDELVDLILEHYEEFDSRYKGFLPLKRVYVPEATIQQESA